METKRKKHILLVLLTFIALIILISNLDFGQKEDDIYSNQQDYNTYERFIKTMAASRNYAMKEAERIWAEKTNEYSRDCIIKYCTIQKKLVSHECSSLQTDFYVTLEMAVLYSDTLGVPVEFIDVYVSEEHTSEIKCAFDHGGFNYYIEDQEIRISTTGIVICVCDEQEKDAFTASVNLSLDEIKNIRPK